MKIIVTAPLGHVDEAYAVATSTIQRIKALKKQGHEVLFLTTETSQYTEEYVGCEIRKELPIWSLYRYIKGEDLREEDKERVEKIKEVFKKYKDYTFIGHDLIIQGYYYPFAVASFSIAKFWHVLHSRPSRETIVTEIPEGHRVMVYHSGLIDEAEKQYKAVSRVHPVPNIVDILEFNKVEDLTREFVEKWDLLSFDYIFTYPFCYTRWSAKGGDFFAKFTKYMNDQGLKTAGIFLLSHANGKSYKEIDWDTCHFSNAMYKEYRFGVSQKVVRDFMWLSDGFLLPSIMETSSRIYKEAALAKNTVILNRVLGLSENLPTANMFDCSIQNMDIILRQFLEESKHLREFRHIRKDLNQESVGKKLTYLLETYA